MTWGWLRMQLVTVFPGTDRDLIDTALQNGYSQILSRRDWADLRGELSLAAPGPRSVTVGVTLDSASVTGSGFTVDLVGRKIKFANAADWYRITDATATVLTLDAPFTGATATVTARIFQDLLALDMPVKAIDKITLPELGWELSMGSIGDPGALASGPPTTWQYGPTFDQPANQRSIRIWPAPDRLYRLNLAFQKAVPGFDGTNTDAEPLGWISSNALLAAAKRSLAVDLAARARTKGNFQEAARLIDLLPGFEKTWGDEIASMENEDNRRLGATEFEPDPHFSRHRRSWRSC